MKKDFLNELKINLTDKIGGENLLIVMDEIIVLLNKYELKKKEASVAVQEDENLSILQRYFTAKAVEGLTQDSLTAYRQTLARFFRSVGKNIKDITTEDIRLFLAEKKAGKASDSYLNFLRRCLSSFFSWCYIEELITKNPTARVKHIRETQKIRKSLSDDDMEVLRFGAKTKRDKAIIEFLYSTGCRVSEMLSIDRNDIDFRNGEVAVLGKGKKYRTVYLSARCKLVLKDYLDSRTDSLDALFISNWEGVVGNFKNKPQRFQKSGVETMLRMLGKRTGIPNVHPHKFRRTVATMALSRGMPIEQIKNMLGHANIQTTTMYALSNDDELKRSHSKFV